MKYEYKDKPQYNRITQTVVPKYELLGDTFIVDWEVRDIDANNQEYIEDPTIEEEISILKNHLQATDYQAIKYAEGWLTAEEYEPIKAQRQQWREEINRLETEQINREA
jgi:hypothetical protein